MVSARVCVCVCVYVCVSVCVCFCFCSFLSGSSSADRRRSGCNLWQKLSTLLGNGPCDTGSLHFTLDVDNDTGIVLEVHPETLTPTPCFLLANHHGLANLLPELWLTLFHSCKDQITTCRLWQTTQLTANPLYCNHVKILGSAVVSTVHDGSHIQTKRHAQLSLPSCTSTLHVYSYLGVDSLGESNVPQP